jgi:hypothetical protein
MLVTCHQGMACLRVTDGDEASSYGKPLARTLGNGQGVVVQLEI